MTEKIIGLMLRIPVSMRDKIAALAIRERRSLNAQMLVLFDEALEARQASQPADTPDDIPPARLVRPHQAPRRVRKAQES